MSSIFDVAAGDDVFTAAEQPRESWGKKAIQTAISSPGGQAALGAAKRYTYPADIFKALVGASAQDTLREQQAENPEINPEIAQQQIQNLSQYIPTQELTERGIENLTGLDLAPQGVIGQISRKGGELASLQPGKFSSAPLRRAGGAAAGATLETGLEAAGVNPIVASLAGAGTAGALSTAPSQATLKSAATKESREVAEKHGLRKFAGLERENPVSGKALASESKLASASKELQDSTLAALEKSVTKGSSAKQMYAKGYDVRSGYKAAYDLARDRAKNDTRVLNIEPVRNYITQEIDRIRAAAPSPSDAERVALNILKKERGALANGAPTSASIMKQYHNYNDNTKPLYRKPEWTGAEREVARTYEGLKQQLSSVLEHQAGPEIYRPFKVANKLFSEQKKLDQIESALGKTEDGAISYDTFQKALRSRKKRASLQRDLGPEAFKELDEIARYGKSAEERVFGNISKIKETPGFVGELNILGKLALGVPLGLAKGLLGKGGVNAARQIRGYMLLRDSTRKDYASLVKAAATGKEAAIRRAASALNKSFESEFGPLDRFIENLSEDESE